MKKVFDYSFKKMVVELSYSKGLVAKTTKELSMDANRLVNNSWIPDIMEYDIT